MKLKNKKTGEIATVEGFGSAEGEIQMAYTIDNDETKLYLYCTPSLTTFNEEWEDYDEKPKTYWRITDLGEVKSVRLDQHHQNIEKCKLIGNYFGTKEEAEKAVEKLKALKQLKDEGMEIYSFEKRKPGIDLDFYTLTILAPRDKDSLDLLFGGEK